MKKHRPSKRMHGWKLIQSFIETMIPFMPFIMPLLLIPLAAGWWWQTAAPAQFAEHSEDLLFAYLIYIVVIRFALLDMMLFYVSSRRRSIHLDLLHIVFLYLEITILTLLFFALLYDLFGVFNLFQYNAAADAQKMQTMRGHSLRVALYISMELFTTLGVGGMDSPNPQCNAGRRNRSPAWFYPGWCLLCSVDLRASGWQEQMEE